MKRSRFSESRSLGYCGRRRPGAPIKAVCTADNISAATYHAWKRKYGGMEVSDAKIEILRPAAILAGTLVQDDRGRFLVIL